MSEKNNYTADILFIGSLVITVILIIYSAINWDLYTDTKYKLMDQEEAQKGRTWAMYMLIGAVLFGIGSVVLYFAAPPRKIIKETIFAKPETKTINVYSAPEPRSLEPISTRVAPAPSPPSPPSRPVTRKIMIPYEIPDPSGGACPLPLQGSPSFDFTGTPTNSPISTPSTTASNTPQMRPSRRF